MTSKAIRKKLTDYLQIADEAKVKAIYTMVKDEIDTVANDWDADFIKELERRSKSAANGTSKLYTWEETKQAAIMETSGK
jgi:hypothetical protein